MAETVRAYERGGAAALSILTEERHFGGSLHDLRAAREASDLPILRKDFIVEPYQLYEAAANGADAVLLIVAALDDQGLAALYGEARAVDLDCLIEVHDERDLERALMIDADVIAINNRDLEDLSVDVETTVELLTDVPAGKTVVSESGYAGREQLDELERIAGGEPEENAATVAGVLEGEGGPPRDVLVLNAGAAILVGGGADDLAQGIERAGEAIDSGAAREVLARLVELTGELARS